VLDLLHPSLRGAANTLATNFAQAEPFRHVVIGNFLDLAFCRELIAEFPAFDPGRAINEMGETGKKAFVPDIVRIGPAYRRFDALMRDPAFLRLTGQMAGIENLLYDPAYVGGGTHDNLDGQELDLHVDFNYHPERPLHRRLNLIVFLNPDWAESWGGCLELQKDPWDPSLGKAAPVIPLANRAVLFETTECSWHGFNRVKLPPDKRHLSRRSVAVYFYTKERPVAETAAPHATVYVPRPLPDHLQPGYTLRNGDVDTLRDLIERRNAQIRFLQERETEFTTLISGITRSPSFRLGRFLTWPARKLRG
jgi:hypothetical protein